MIKKILIATDGSPSSLSALEMGKTLLAGQEGRRVILLTVVSQEIVYGSGALNPSVDLYFPVFTMEKPTNKILDTYKDGLIKLAAKYFDKDTASECLVEIGHAAEVICQTAEEKNVDLVILGSRGFSSLKGLLLGSVSDWVCHHSKKPVLIAK